MTKQTKQSVATCTHIQLGGGLEGKVREGLEVRWGTIAVALLFLGMREGILAGGIGGMAAEHS